MVWVRYDDEFHHHDKVMEARDADPGSLALHLLGNTWTASSKRPGWIPAYVPRQLVGAKGRKWAQILVDARLWDVDEFEGKPGWWVHDFDTYNPVDEETRERRSASARKAANARWHPEFDLSSEEFTSGVTGPLPNPPDEIDAAETGLGQQSPGKRDASPHAARMPGASETHAEAMPSDAIARGRPVPLTPNSTTSNGSPTVPAGAVPRAVTAYVEAAQAAGVACPEESQSRVSKSARSLLAQGYPEADVTTAARNAAIGGWTDLATQLQRDTSRASPAAAATRTSVTDERVNGALEAGRAVAAADAQLAHATRKALQ